LFSSGKSELELLEAAPVKVIEERDGINYINKEIFNMAPEKELNSDLKKLISSLTKQTK
jgi:hypothetical protein